MILSKPGLYLTLCQRTIKGLVIQCGEGFSNHVVYAGAIGRNVWGGYGELIILAELKQLNVNLYVLKNDVFEPYISFAPSVANASVHLLYVGDVHYELLLPRAGTYWFHSIWYWLFSCTFSMPIATPELFVFYVQNLSDLHSGTVRRASYCVALFFLCEIHIKVTWETQHEFCLPC